MAYSTTLTITVSPTDRPALYRAELDGRHLVTARTPLLAAARVLLGEGVPPATRIAMRWAGSEVDAMRSTVGAAAELTVADDDRGVRFVPHRALDAERAFAAAPVHHQQPAALPA